MMLSSSLVPDMDDPVSLNLLIQPSLHDKIKDIAKGRGASVNDTIHQILQDYVDGQGAE